LTARLSLSRQQNHNPQGRVPYSLASSLRMVVPLMTTTSRRRAPFTWCCVSRKACRSLSRPSLARRPVFGQVVASSTCFPLEEPAYASRDKSPSRTISLRLARQVQLRLVRGAQTHNSGVATDAHEGANLHVTRRQQLAAMQATCPDKSLKCRSD
jgi:hypothetical protein